MNAKTLEALRGSILKWERIVAGTGKDLGWTNCPLCLLFFLNSRLLPGQGCDGCPVREKTGLDDCKGTPYWEFWPYHADEILSPVAKKRAQEELDFLRFLLPKKPVKK